MWAHKYLATCRCEQQRHLSVLTHAAHIGLAIDQRAHHLQIAVFRRLPGPSAMAPVPNQPMRIALGRSVVGAQCSGMAHRGACHRTAANLVKRGVATLRARVHVGAVIEQRDERERLRAHRRVVQRR